LTRGLFITIEGPEGAGKTTQARLLYEHLRSRYPVVYTREPGGTAIGERIRALLLDVSHTGMSPLTEMLLFAASRAQFVAEVVEPALREGRLLLSERYVDASIAYQGFGRGLMPDLTILLDIDPALGLQRARQTAGKEGRPGHGDRLEQESLSFHVRVRAGFLAIAHEEPDRIRVVDGSRAQGVVHDEVVRLVEGLLRARGWRGSDSS